MLSEAERRVLAEIELVLRTEDAKFVARFDAARIRRRRRRLVVLGCLPVLVVAALMFAAGAPTAALTWVSLAGSLATVATIWRALKRRGRWAS